ncbi:MAG: bifunctional diaminohydroxyphosphoribosylaminopyrimidine deaminase/5-amino-6-(5-phosphoribosylamino)uracil reductase RibD [Candidatus Fimivivens sp.]
MHQHFMRSAIHEAQKGAGKTYKNPLVGAVIVKNERIIAFGAHLLFGEAHAEINAIHHCQSPQELLDSTLYVTLEPCNHHGKQPPCTQAIIKAGIKKVVIGQLDPNPLVAGDGKVFLEKQGIKVIVGIEEAKCKALNPHYNYFHAHNRPYITLKQAVTLDGKISLSNGVRYPITGQAALSRVRKERGNYQAIVIGSETALIDNPCLLPEKSAVFPPVRIILDRRGRLLSHLELNLFRDSTSPVWIFTEQEKVCALPPHVRIFSTARFSLAYFIDIMRAEGIQSLYIEGGAKVHDAFLAANLWDALISYIAPKLIGGNGPSAFSSARCAQAAKNLLDINIEQLGNDLRIEGVRKPCLQD